MRAVSVKLVMLVPVVGDFTDDKDEAKRIRTEILMPAIEQGMRVILDFKSVRTSTQSFVHALLGEVLGRFKEPVLKKLEFKNCSPQIKGLVELVVDYSLGGFSGPEKTPTEAMGKRSRKVHPA